MKKRNKRTLQTIRSFVEVGGEASAQMDAIGITLIRGPSENKKTSPMRLKASFLAHRVGYWDWEEATWILNLICDLAERVESLEARLQTVKRKRPNK